MESLNETWPPFDSAEDDNDSIDFTTQSDDFDEANDEEAYSDDYEGSPLDRYEKRKLSRSQPDANIVDAAHVPSLGEYVQLGLSNDPFCRVVSLLYESMIEAGPDICNDSEFSETCGAIVNDISTVPAHENASFNLALRSIHGKLVSLSSSRNLVKILDALADGSREEAWRVPLAESGILAWALSELKSEDVFWDFEECPKFYPILRLVCNCVADNDDNREIALRQEFKILKVLSGARGLVEIRTALSTLFNLASDYPPAQHALPIQEVCEFIKLIFESDWCTFEIDNLILQVLDHFGTDVDYGDFILYHFSAQIIGGEVEEERFCDVLEILIKWLTPEMIDAKLRSGPIDGQFKWPVCVYLRTVRFGQGNLLNSGPLDYPGAFVGAYQPFEDEERMETLRKALLETIADYCNHNRFPQNTNEEGLYITVSTWLNCGEVKLQVAACIILGNLLRGLKLRPHDPAPDRYRWPPRPFFERYNLYAERENIVKGLFAIITINQDASLTFSALGCARNFALWPVGKVLLVQQGFIPIISKARFFEISVLPQLMVTALALIRLLVDNILAVGELMGRGSAARDLMSERTNEHPEPHFGFLVMLEIFHATDTIEVKVEIARIVIRIIKTIGATPDVRVPGRVGLRTGLENDENADAADDDAVRLVRHDPEQDDTTKMFCQRRLIECRDDIKKTMAFLCSLKEHPAIRSEVIFTLALLAKNDDPDRQSAQLVLDILADPVVHEFMNEVVEAGRKADEDRSNKDWENAMVMLIELRANGHEMKELVDRAWHGRRAVREDEIVGR